MCGIVGIAYRDPQRPVPADVIRTMCGTLRHRGPDDEGLHVSGPVGLGMRRLSIIDLAGGRQPIANEDGSKVIVFNGEIYNYRDLRHGLIARAHRFRTQSDTETVLHLYEERGPACVEELRGMFAFAIWDAAAHTLFLARDRFGIKPLYVVAAPWGIAFASELKALVAAELTSKELDWNALDMYFQLGYIPAPASSFRDVRKLEPGHTLVWRADGPCTRRGYWDIPLDAVAEPPDIEERVLEWIDESVAAHLVSDVPVAAFLSGGLDSSAVLSSMALSGEPPHAFTARYFGSGAEGADETELARQLAARYGAKLTLVEIRPDVHQTLEPIVYALDEPHADDSSIPTWALSQIVGSTYKVALTGIGGDELFAGYRRHIGLLLGQRYGRLPLRVRQAAYAAAQRLREPEGGALGVDRLKRFLRAGNGAVPDLFLRFVSRISDAERARLYSPCVREEVSGHAAPDWFHRLYCEAGTPGDLTAALYLDYKTYLPDDVLALSDRLAMAHSLEIRVPLVDHVLVEKAFPLPEHVKVGRWRNKRLLKRALRRRLPSDHLRAPKRGFVGPTAAWLRNELRPMLLDELSAERVARLGYFDAQVVARLLDEHFSRRHNREGILWALLCFSVWHRLYVEDRRLPLDAER